MEQELIIEIEHTPSFDIACFRAEELAREKADEIERVVKDLVFNYTRITISTYRSQACYTYYFTVTF